MVRHHYVMANGVPIDYQQVRNPLKPTAETLEDGRKLYDANCASCHGPKGYGDGPAGAQLNPRPANVAALMRMGHMASDAYLAWTIGEGGVPVKSAMPPFKTILSEKERWEIITYMQFSLGQASR